MTLSIPEKIQRIQEATTMVRAYNINLNDILEQGTPFDFSDLQPHLDTMSSIAPDLDSLSPDVKQQVKGAVRELRLALDDLLMSATSTKNDLMGQTKKVKSHTKSASAYLKADAGVGI